MFTSHRTAAASPVAPNQRSRPRRDTSNDIAILGSVPPEIVTALYEEAERQVNRWVRQGVPQALAETAAYDNIEQALAYLAEQSFRFHGQTPTERERIRTQTVAVYRKCVQSDLRRDIRRVKDRDGGCLDAPVYPGSGTLTSGDTVAVCPASQSDGMPFDPNDAQGGWFGRELRHLLYTRYRPEQAEQLWARLRYDLDWKDVDAGHSVEAVRRWGTRQIPVLRKALEENGMSQSASAAALPKGTKRNTTTNAGRGNKNHVGT